MKLNKPSARFWLRAWGLLMAWAACLSAQQKPAHLAPAPPAKAYLSGQPEVVIGGQPSPPIRLGLARDGVTVIEFPATDRLFAVHPGASRRVAVDESPTLATDHYLVVRAGPDFFAPKPGGLALAALAATVSVQMESGLFLTFIFYPVADVADMAHRCTLRYVRSEIVAARRAVGLAVNLATPATLPTPEPATSQTRIDTPATRPENLARTLADKPQTLSPEAGAAAIHRALQSAMKFPATFSHWHKARHGLALAMLAPSALDAQHSLAVVAVRNTSRRSLRLLPAQPELLIATLDEHGQTRRQQAWPTLYADTTARTGEIPAGVTVYYAVVYVTPVLDAGQRLRWAAAHTQAADEPALATLAKE